MAGDEPAVTETAGVAQVEVAVAAHELHEQLAQRILAGGVEVPLLGERRTDGKEPAAAFGSRRQAGADRMRAQRRVQGHGELVQPWPVQRPGGIEDGPATGRARW